MNIDDTSAIDEVLTTTRAVRRRLDLDRPVDNQLILDCIDIAEQAPTGGNLGSRRWTVVRDQQVKDRLGDLYRRTALPFLSAAAGKLHGTGHPQEKVMASSAHLAEHHKLQPGATGPDGSLTLENVYCLGNCGLGPAALLDERLIGRVDEARLDEIIAGARR